MPRKRTAPPVVNGAHPIMPFPVVAPGAPGNAPPGPAVASVAPAAGIPPAAAGNRLAGPGEASAEVVEATARALTRAMRAGVHAVAREVAAGRVQSDSPAWRDMIGAVFRPLMAAADRTFTVGVPSVEAAVALFPPAHKGFPPVDPALVEAIMRHRAAGQSAVTIAKALAPTFRRKIEPSWVRSVYVKRGDPAPESVRGEDAARERKKLANALKRAREIGMI